MFRTKYTITILSSKWEKVISNIKVDVIPRQDEYLYFGTKYYKVMTVVHDYNVPKRVFIIIDDNPVEMAVNYLTDNQSVIKITE